MEDFPKIRRDPGGNSKNMKSMQCEPEEFGERIIFMSMFNEIECRKNDTECIHNSIAVSKYARRFPRRYWSFLGPGLEKTRYRTCTKKPNRKWDKTAASMILQLVTGSGHPVFRASNAFERRQLEKREYGNNSTRLSDNDRNMVLLFRTIKICQSA